LANKAEAAGALLASHLRYVLAVCIQLVIKQRAIKRRSWYGTRVMCDTRPARRPRPPRASRRAPRALTGAHARYASPAAAGVPRLRMKAFRRPRHCWGSSRTPHVRRAASSRSSHPSGAQSSARCARCAARQGGLIACGARAAYLLPSVRMLCAIAVTLISPCEPSDTALPRRRAVRRGDRAPRVPARERQPSARELAAQRAEEADRWSRSLGGADHSGARSLR
jgi:hypothetical protein